MTSLGDFHTNSNREVSVRSILSIQVGYIMIMNTCDTFAMVFEQKNVTQKVYYKETTGSYNC